MIGEQPTKLPVEPEHLPSLDRPQSSVRVEIAADFPEQEQFEAAMTALLAHPDAFAHAKTAQELPEIKAADPDDAWAVELAHQLEVAEPYKAAGWSAHHRQQLVEQLIRADREGLPIQLDFGKYGCGNWHAIEPQPDLQDYGALKTILGILQIVAKYQTRGMTSPCHARLVIADLTDPAAAQREPRLNQQYVTKLRAMAAQLTSAHQDQLSQIELQIITESEQLAEQALQPAEFETQVQAMRELLTKVWAEVEVAYQSQLEIIQKRELEQGNQNEITWDTVLSAPWDESLLLTPTRHDTAFYTREYLGWFTNEVLEKLPNWQQLPNRQLLGGFSPRFQQDLLQKVAQLTSSPLNQDRELLRPVAIDWLARQLVTQSLQTPAQEQTNKTQVATVPYTFAKPMTDQPSAAMALKSLGALTQLDLPPWEQTVEICRTSGAPNTLMETAQPSSTKKRQPTLSARAGLSFQRMRPGKDGQAGSATLHAEAGIALAVPVRHFSDSTPIRVTKNSMTPRP
jgi:hypothetical protein